MNATLTKCKKESGFRPDSRGANRIWLKGRILQMKSNVPVQVIDFSPVVTIFHIFSPIFHPIFQPEGFGFSPVTEFSGGNLCVLTRKKIHRNTRRERRQVVGRKNRIMSDYVASGKSEWEADPADNGRVSTHNDA